MGDSSIAEQTSSSHRNTSINTNAKSSFITATCVWVQRLSGTTQRACATIMRLEMHLSYHMKQSLKLADLKDECLTVFLIPQFCENPVNGFWLLTCV